MKKFIVPATTKSFSSSDELKISMELLASKITMGINRLRTKTIRGKTSAENISNKVFTHFFNKVTDWTGNHSG